MKVILISGKAQHGKDTLAAYLKEDLEAKGKRVCVLHYATLLKSLCRQIYLWNGRKDEKGRTLLQKTGDMFRSVDQNYFVSHVLGILKTLKKSNEFDYVLIPDTRFPNEISMIRQEFPGKSSLTVRVERPGFISNLSNEQKMHPSETALDNFPFDVVVKSTSIEELKKNEKELLLILLPDTKYSALIKVEFTAENDEEAIQKVKDFVVRNRQVDDFFVKEHFLVEK